MATVEQIKKDIARKTIVAMETTKKRVCQIIWEVCMRYYGEYSPSQYMRTFQIAQEIQNMANRALTVRSSGIGAGFEIYIDDGMFSHDLGTWSEQQVLDSVMTYGDHGRAMPGGTPVWVNGEEIVSAQIGDIVKQELIRAGIPII